MLNFKSRTLILDGAMGTELERRGFKTRLPIWSAQALLAAPELVRQIHKEYVEAGADIITTNTFRTNPYTITKAKIDIDPERLTKIACDLAKQAASISRPLSLVHRECMRGFLTPKASRLGSLSYDKEIFVAGSVAPVEDCFSPELSPGEKLAEKDHYEHIKNLKDGGVDFILAETMISIKEALIVLKQARKLKIPIMVSFALNNKGDILNGDNLIEALKQVSKYKPLAFLINCTTLDIIEKVIDSLLDKTKIPIGVYPNFGPPVNHALLDSKNSPISVKENLKKGGVKGKFAKYLTPEKFAKSMLRLNKKGVKILGGCCGTQPEHIRALANLVKK